MPLNWCFNEPWPTAANSSVISFLARPKPAYFEVQAACRPTALAARFDRLVWRTGDLFECDLHVLNDSSTQVEPGRIRIELVSGDNRQHVLTWDHDAVPTNTNLAGPRCRIQIPNWDSDHFVLSMQHESYPEYDASYRLLLAYAGERPAFYQLNQ